MSEEGDVRALIGHCSICDAPLRVADGRIVTKDDEGQTDQAVVLTQQKAGDSWVATPHWLSCPDVPPMTMLGYLRPASEVMNGSD